MKSTISPKDYKMLESLLKIEISRYSRNPTTYHSNLFQRALDIVAEHISEDAEQVESEKSYFRY